MLRSGNHPDQETKSLIKIIGGSPLPPTFILIMAHYHISQLAHLCELSRSTLLYYDRVGLLPPSGRTDAGYRYYTEKDLERLRLICHYRQAGLAIEDIQMMLALSGYPSFPILEKRFQEIGGEIRQLKTKQTLLSHMMKGISSDYLFPEVDKAMWVEMLHAAGMDDQAMKRWHGEFETRAPEAHHEFLLSLGISEQETREIRKWSAEVHENKKY
jgi:DNA-binding transcriptional MerR regulator